MELSLHLSGPSASNLSESLRDDLFNSDLDQLEEVYRKSEAPKEGELGHSWLDILNVAFAGSGFLLALAAFIREWLKDRKEDIEISLEINGMTATVSGKNEKEIIQKIKALEAKFEQSQTETKEE